MNSLAHPTYFPIFQSSPPSPLPQFFFSKALIGKAGEWLKEAKQEDEAEQKSVDSEQNAYGVANGMGFETIGDMYLVLSSFIIIIMGSPQAPHRQLVPTGSIHDDCAYTGRMFFFV